MEAFWVQFLATFVLLIQTASTSNTTEVFGALGQSVTFRGPDTDGDAAVWSFGNDPIVTVIFKDLPVVAFVQDKFKTRFAVTEEGRALRIPQLSLDDVGTYTVNINGEKSIFILQVFREVPEPRVSCEAQNCSGPSGSCRLSLRCSAAPGAALGNVSYSWRVGAQLWGRGPVLALGNGSGPWQGTGTLSCTATNQVSSSNVTVSNPWELCAENSTHPQDPGAHSGNLSWIGAMTVSGAAVILLVFLIFFCKSPGWRKFHFSKPNPMDTAARPEYTTVYAEVAASQNGVPKGPKPNPREGESSRTIYSLVKRPEQVGNAAGACLELV